MAIRIGKWSLVLLILGVSCHNKIDQTIPHLLVSVRVSLGDNNQQGNNAVMNGNLSNSAVVNRERADMSDDGRFIVFSSLANNLVPNDTNSASDIFLRDMVLQTTTLVSVNAAGTASGNAPSSQPAISGDGRFVAFVSLATDIISFPAIDVNAKTDAVPDIFVRDMLMGQTILISRASGQLGTKSTGSSQHPRMSKDGRFVVFDSTATNIDPADTDGQPDVYLRQIAPGAGQFTTTLISRASTVAGVLGAKGTAAPLTSAFSQFPAISRDGNLIVYESTCTNLVGGGEGGPKGTPSFDIFMRNVLAQTTIRVTIIPPPSLTLDPNGDSTSASISDDGTVVTWRSTASNFFPGDDSAPDIFVRDFKIAPTTIELISVATSGAHAGSGCNHPVAIGDGTSIIWQSPSTSLVDNDTNGCTDIFRHDRTTGITSRVSVSTYGGQLNAQSFVPAVTSDGRYVSFYTEATNVVDNDTNGAADIYLRGPPF